MDFAPRQSGPNKELIQARPGDPSEYANITNVCESERDYHATDDLSSAYSMIYQAKALWVLGWEFERRN
jgi:hypothetical protein